MGCVRITTAFAPPLINNDDNEHHFDYKHQFIGIMRFSPSVSTHHSSHIQCIIAWNYQSMCAFELEYYFNYYLWMCGCHGNDFGKYRWWRGWRVGCMLQVLWSKFEGMLRMMGILICAHLLLGTRLFVGWAKLERDDVVYALQWQIPHWALSNSWWWMIEYVDFDYVWAWWTILIGVCCKINRCGLWSH